jgi:hypothetical protein
MYECGILILILRGKSKRLSYRLQIVQTRNVRLNLNTFLLRAIF